MAITIDGAGTITGLDADGISSQPVFAGQVLQVVRATDSTDRSTTSASFVDAGINVTITPRSASSVILLLWSSLRAATRGFAAVGVLVQITDSSNTPVSGAEGGFSGFFVDGLSGTTTFDVASVTIAYATPASTSPVTYKGRFSVDTNGSATLKNGSMTGQLFAIEVAA